MLQNMMGGCALDSPGSGYRHLAGYCQQGNYPSGSIKCRDYPNQVRNNLLSKDCAPCRDLLCQEESKV